MPPKILPNNQENNSVHKTRNTRSAKQVESELVEQLDEKLKPLWILINTKFEEVHKSLDDNSTKLINLENRVNKIESIINDSEMRFFKELNERSVREKNFIIYNYADSKNACNSDLKDIQGWFQDSAVADKLPFNPKNIKVRRIGKNYVKDKTRPILVKLFDSDQVHWVFVNKNEIFPEGINIANDLTLTQRQHFNNVKNELKNRMDKGEKDLTIKHFFKVPHIVKKRSE